MIQYYNWEHRFNYKIQLYLEGDIYVTVSLRHSVIYHFYVEDLYPILENRQKSSTVQYAI